MPEKQSAETLSALLRLNTEMQSMFRVAIKPHLATEIRNWPPSAIPTSFAAAIALRERQKRIRHQIITYKPERYLREAQVRLQPEDGRGVQIKDTGPNRISIRAGSHASIRFALLVLDGLTRSLWSRRMQFMRQSEFLKEFDRRYTEFGIGYKMENENKMAEIELCDDARLRIMAFERSKDHVHELANETAELIFGRPRMIVLSYGWPLFGPPHNHLVNETSRLHRVRQRAIGATATWDVPTPFERESEKIYLARGESASKRVKQAELIHGVWKDVMIVFCQRHETELTGLGLPRPNTDKKMERLSLRISRTPLGMERTML